MLITQWFQEDLWTLPLAGGKSPQWSCGDHIPPAQSPTLIILSEPLLKQVSKISTFITLKT